MRSMAVSIAKKGGIPPDMGGIPHVEGRMPLVFSPRRAPIWGSPRGENVDVCSAVRLLLLQGNALQSRQETAISRQLTLPRGLSIAVFLK